MGAADRGEASEGLQCKHIHLENEARVQAAKLAPVHVVNWGEAQEADTMLATCRRWLCTHKDNPFPRRDTLLKKYLGNKEGCTLSCMHNSLSKGLLYVSTTPKGEAEGILAFVVPTCQCCTALNGVHCDAGHRGQQRTLALMQEQFWWPMMVDDCQALVQGHMHCWNSSTSTSPVWSQQWSSTSHLVLKMC